MLYQSNKLCKCTLCGSIGTNKSTCPLNLNAKNHDNDAHYSSINKTALRCRTAKTRKSMKGGSNLSGDPNVDIEILLNMEDNDLKMMCSTSKYINSLCKKPELQLIMMFSSDIKKFLTDINPQILYQQIMSLKDKYKSKIIYIIKTAIKTKPGLSHYYQNETQHLIRYNYMEILKLFIKLGILPSKDFIIDKNIYSNLEILKLLANYKFPFTIQGADIAASSGHLDVLKWLANRGTFPDKFGANGAAIEGHLDVLDWLVSKDIFPSQEVGNNLADDGNLNMLKWLVGKGILPTTEWANWAASKNKLDILEWLDEIGILPTIKGANWAAGSKNMNVLKWLDEKGILPDENGANEAAIIGRLSVLKWLAEKGIFPNEEGIHKSMLINNNNMKLHNWFIDNHLL